MGIQGSECRQSTVTSSDVIGVLVIIVLVWSSRWHRSFSMDGLKRVVETTRSDFFLLLPMLLCIRAFNLDTENTIARGMDSSVTGGRDFAFGVSVTIHQTESGFR